ncbi:hypothetical protein ACVMB0_005431 [Bradyrhizobium sp. USDA 4451]
MPAIPHRRLRPCTGSARRSSGGSTIPTLRRRASRRPKGFRNVTCRSCSRGSATISRTMCASAGCSVPGPTCPIRARRIARFPRSPIASASAILLISAAPSAIASVCRHANSANRRLNAQPPRRSASAAGRRMRWHSCARISRWQSQRKPRQCRATMAARFMVWFMVFLAHRLTITSRSRRRRFTGAISAARCRRRPRSHRATPSRSRRSRSMPPTIRSG